MVAIVSGNSLGLSLTSLATLGENGSNQLPGSGRSGEQAFVNVSNGNLVLQDRDDYLVSTGLDAEVLRTYNSQGGMVGGVQDSWAVGVARQRVALTSGALQSAGSILTRTDRDGAEATYLWDAAASRYRSSAGAGAYDEITWDSAKSHFVWTDGDTSLVERYEQSGRLVSSTDADGHTMAYAYNANGSLARMTGASGEVTAFDYVEGKLSQIRKVLADGSTSTLVRYSYDLQGRLSAVIVDISPTDNAIADGDTYGTTYGYVGNSLRIATVTQTDGSRLSFTYVQVGSEYRVATVQDALLQTTSYSYDTNSRTTTVIDPLGFATVYEYDDLGQLTRIISSAANSAPVSQPQSHIELQTIAVAQLTVQTGLDEVGRSYMGWAQAATGTLVSWRFRPQGGTEGQWVSLPTVAASGQRRVDLSNLSPGSYEFDLLETAPGSSVPTARATGAFTVETKQVPAPSVNQISVQNIAVAVRTNAGGNAWMAWEAPAAGTQVAWHYRLKGAADAPWASLASTLDAATGLQGVDLGSLAAGTYEYELTQKATGLAQPGAYAIGTVAISAPGSLEPTGNELQTVQLAQITVSSGVDEASHVYMGWEQPAAGTSVNWRVRPQGGTEAQWVSVASTVVEGQQRVDLSSLAAGTYEFDLLQTAPGSLVPTAKALGTFTLDPVQPDHLETRQIAVQAVPVQIAETSTGQALMGWVPPAAGTTVTWRYRPQGGGEASWVKLTPALDSHSGLQAVNLNGLVAGTYEYDLVQTASGASVPAAHATGLLTIYPVPPGGYVAKDIAVQAVQTEAFIYKGQALMTWSQPASGTQVTWRYKNANGQWINLTPRTGVVSGKQSVNLSYVPPGTWEYELVQTASGSANPTGHATGTFEIVAATQDHYETVEVPVATIQVSSWVKPNETRPRATLAWPITPNVTTSLRYRVAGSTDGWKNGRTPTNLDGVYAGIDVSDLYSSYGTTYEFALVQTLSNGGNPVAHSTGLLNVVANKPGTTGYGTSVNIQTGVVAPNGQLVQQLDESGNYYNIPVSPTRVAQVFVAATPLQTSLVSTTTSGYVSVQVWVNGVAPAPTFTSSTAATRAVQLMVPTPRTVTISNDVVSAIQVLVPTYASASAPSHIQLQTAQPAEVAVSSGVDSASRPYMGWELPADGTAVTWRYRPHGGTHAQWVSVAATVAGDQQRVDLSSLAAGAYEFDLLHTAPGNAVPTARALGTFVVDKLAPGTIIASITSDPVSTMEVGVLVQADVSLWPVVPSGVQQIRMFTYNARGDVISVDDGQGQRVAMQYDAAGNLVLRRDALGNTVVRSFNTTNQLVSETVYLTPDPDGAGAARASVPLTSHYIYASTRATQLRFSVSAEGRVTQHRYNARGERISTLTYTQGAFSGSSFSESALMAWAAAQPLAGVTRTDMLYDSRGQIETTVAYAALDAAGQGLTDGSESVTRYVYDAAGRLLTTIDATGDVTGYSYDGLGRLLAVTNGLGEVTINSYDDRGNKTTVTSANGLSTTSAYDRAGRLISVTHTSTAGNLGTTRYDYAANRLVATEDATGARSWLLYDSAGRKTADIDGNGSLTEYRYSVGGLLTQTIQYATSVSIAALADGNGTPLNPNLDVIRPATSPEDRSSWRSYDSAGRLAKTVDGTGAVTEYTYDGASRLITTRQYATALTNNELLGSHPSPADISVAQSADDRISRSFYDADGLLQATLDGEGYLSELHYDTAARLIGKTVYATATQADLRAGGTLSQLRSAETDADARTVYLLNGKNQIAAEIDAEGYLTEKVYDADGHLTQSTRFASQLAPGYTAGSTLASIRPAAQPSDRTTKWTYDSLGRVSLETNAEGSQTQYTYDSAGNLLTAVKAVNTTDSRAGIAAHYDVQGRLTGELSANGFALLNGWQNQSQVEEIWLQHGITHTYDAAGRRTSTLDQNRNRTLFYYDVDGHLTHSVNAMGEVTETRYNVLGQRSAEIRYGTRISTIGLDGGIAGGALLDKLSSIASPLKDSRVSYAHDASGNVTSIVDALGHAISLAYNSFGEETQRTFVTSAGVQRTDTSLRDLRGLVTGQTSSDGGTLSVSSATTYDAFGRAIRSTDANGNVRQQSYDRLGRAVLSIDPLSAGRSTSYDAFDRVLTQTDALGNTTRFSYDMAKRTVSVTSPENITVSTHYDRLGQTQSVTDGRGNVTSFSYDKNGNRLSTDSSLPLSSSTYDSANRLIETEDANGHTVTFTYDAANRVLARTVDPAGLKLTTSYEYDAAGQQIAVTDANGTVTQLTYDLKGQLVRTVTDPQGLSLVTLYEYGASGETLKVTSPGNPVIEYSYDALGRRLGERVDPTGVNQSTTYSYDANGNVTSKTDALQQVTRYAYDANDRLVYTASALGELQENSYDAEGRIVRVTAYAHRAQVDGMSSALSAADVQQLIVTSPGLDSDQYRIYDRQGRLVTVTRAGESVRYTYDANGNVIQRTAGASAAEVATSELSNMRPASFSPAPDQITRTVYDTLNRAIYIIDGAGGVVSLTYDGNGNVVERRAYARPVAIDVSGELSHEDVAQTLVASSADQVERNVYDAANRLVWRADGLGAVTRMVYDADGNLAGTTQFANAISAGLALDSVVASAADRVTLHAYDSANRRTFEVNALGGVTRWSYDSAGRATARTLYGAYVIRPTGGMTITDALMSGLQLEGPDDRIERWVYDSVGRQIMAVDASGAVTENRYDALGNNTVTGQYARAISTGNLGLAPTEAQIRLLLVSDPANDRATIRAFDANHRVIHSVDSMLYAHHNEYDGLGNLVKTTAYAAPVYASVNENTIAHEIERIRNAEKDRASTFSYDAAGRIKTATDAMGFTERYTYNELGQKTAFVNKNGDVWTYQYDAAGRLTREVSPPVTVARLAQVGTNLVLDEVRSTAQSIVTELSYDALGNLTSRKEGVGLEEERETRYEYDALGRQVKVIYPGSSTYDASADDLALNGIAGDALRAETHADLWTSTDYNVFGDAVVGRDASGNYSYKAYDELGQLAWEVDALNFVTGHDRNAFGESTRLVRYAGQVSLGNAAGAVVSSADIQAAVTKAKNHEQDRQLRTDYDKLGRVVRVTEPVVFGYDPNAPAEQQYFQAGKVTENTYDAFGSLTQVALVGNTPAERRVENRYYDKVGNNVLVIDTMGYVTAQAFDGQRNLTRRVEYANSIAGWNGNSAGAGKQPPAALPTVSGEDRQVSTSYDLNNRKVSDTRVGMRYVDTRINLATTGDVSTTYGYDEVGNLTRSTDAEGESTYSFYDALGRLRAVVAPSRHAMVNGAITAVNPLTAYGHDAHGNVLVSVEYAGGGTLSADKTTVSALGNPGNRVTTTAYDRFGHAIHITDAGGYNHYASFDAAGRVAKEWRNVTIGGALRTQYTVHQYDALGRLTQSVTPASTVVTAGATGIDVISPATAGTDRQTLEYNAFGEVVRRGINGGRQEYFEYDASGRLWRTNGEDGVHKVFFYDRQGNRTAEISNAGQGHEAINVGALLRADQVKDLTDVRRTDTYYDALGRVVKQVRPDRAEAQGGVTLRQNHLAISILQSISPIYQEAEVGPTFNGWGGQNSVALSWASLAGLGAGDVRVEIDYEGISGFLVDGPHVPASHSAVYTAAQADAGVIVGWGTEGQATPVLLRQITRVRVQKKNLSGEWQDVLDRTQPGTFGYTLEVTTPDGVNTPPRLQTRPQGSQTWIDVPLPQTGTFGKVSRFDASVLGAGVHEYRVLTRQLDGSEVVTATGQVNLNPPALKWLNINMGFGPAGQGVFAWQIPPYGTTQQLVMLNMSDPHAQWAAVDVQPHSGYSGVDLRAQAAGQYQYKLLWTRVGESSPYAQSTGQLTVERPTGANTTAIPPIANVKVSEPTIDGVKVAVLHWPAPHEGTGSVLWVRLKDALETSWVAISSDQFGTMDGGTAGPQKYARLDKLDAGAYEFKLIFSAGNDGTPTQYMTGVVNVKAKFELRQIDVADVPNLSVGVVAGNGHAFMSWALPPAGSGTMWRYRAVGAADADWMVYTSINGVKTGDRLLDVPELALQGVDLYGIPPGQYEYELWNAYQSSLPTHRSAGVMTILPPYVTTVTIPVTSQQVSVSADPSTGQPRMTWTLPEPGTLTRWIYRPAGGAEWTELTTPTSSVTKVDLSSLAPGQYEYRLLMATPGSGEPTHYASGSLTINAPVPAHVELVTIPVQPITVQGAVVQGNQHPYLWWSTPPAGTLTMARYRVAGGSDSQWVTAALIADPATGRTGFDLFGLAAGKYEFDVWQAYPGSDKPTHRAMGSVTVYAETAPQYQLQQISVQPVPVHIGTAITGQPVMAWSQPPAGTTVIWRYRPFGGTASQWLYLSVVTDPSVSLQAVGLQGIPVGDYDYEMVQTAPGSTQPTAHATGMLRISAPTGGYYTMQWVPVAIVTVRTSLTSGGLRVMTWPMPASGTTVTFRYRLATSSTWSTLSVVNDPSVNLQVVNLTAIAAGSYNYEMVQTASGSAVPTAHATGAMSVQAPTSAYYTTQQVAVPLVQVNPLTVYPNGVAYATMNWPAPADGAVSTFLYRVQGSGSAWSTAAILHDPSVNMWLANLNPLGAGNFEFEMRQTLNGTLVRGAGGTITLNGSAGITRNSLVSLYKTEQVYVAATNPVPVITATSSGKVYANVWVPPVTVAPTVTSSTTSTMLWQVLVPGALPVPLVTATPQTSMVIEEWVDEAAPLPGYTNEPVNSLLIETLVVPPPSYTDTAGSTMTVEVALDNTTPTLDNTTLASDPNARLRVTVSHINELPGASQPAADKATRPVVHQTVDRWGNVLAISDPRNAAWQSTYRYNANNQLVEQTKPTDAGGQDPTTYLWHDAAGRQLGVIDALGHANWQRYDAGGNVILEHHADGGEVNYQYDIFGNRVTTIDARGFDTGYSYDKLGRLTQTSRMAVPSYHVEQNSFEVYTVHADNGPLVRRTETYTYDELGQQTSSTDTAGQTTQYIRDIRGDIVRTVTAAGQVTNTVWDSQHRKLLEMQSGGKTATWRYDYFGQLTEHQDQGGATYAYEYDSARQLVKQSNTRGQMSEYAYDAAGQLTQQKSFIHTQEHAASGTAMDVWNTTRYRYDLAGHRTRETVLQTTRLDDGRWVDATYQDNHLSYDALGRLTLVEDGHAQVRMSYDAVGNRTRVQTHVILGEADRRDEDRHFRYDAMNRQTHVNVTANGDVGQNGHHIDYDLAGNRVRDHFAEIDEKGATTYHTDVYSYDAQGRLVDATRNGSLIDQRYYDTAGRAVRSMSADGAEIRTTEFNANGTTKFQRVQTRDAQTGELANKFVDMNYTGYDESGQVKSYDMWNRVGLENSRGTYTNTYTYFEGARQASQHVVHNPEARLREGHITWNYDVMGNLIGLDDETNDKLDRTLVNDANGNALYAEQDGHVQRQLIVNGEVLGRYGEHKVKDTYQQVADFDFNYRAIDGNHPATVPTEYTVGAGSTLQSIAKAVYGDSRMWYLIADANGLAGNSDLQVGQSLRIPPAVGSKFNSATDFKPYDPSKIVGDTTPHQKLIPPKKKSGFGKILMVIVAIVATIFTAGAASLYFAGTLGSTLGTAGVAGVMTAGTGALMAGSVGALAIGAAGGSIASQAVGMATGVQEKFSWKAVALSALAGGIGAGVGQLAQGTALASNGFGAAAARAAIGNVVTQGIGVATGLQEKFDWRGVAASAAAAGVGQVVGGAMGMNNPAFNTLPFGEQFGARLVTGLAAGTTAAVMRGGKVAIQQVAVDAFGNALGSSLAESMSGTPTGAAQQAHVDNDEGYRLPGRYVAHDNPDVVFEGNGLQLGRRGLGSRFSPQAIQDWSDEIEGGMVLRSMRDSRADAPATAEMAQSKAPARQQAAQGATRTVGAGAGRGFVNPGDVNPYPNNPVKADAIVESRASMIDQWGQVEDAGASGRSFGKYMFGRAMRALGNVGYDAIEAVIGSSEKPSDIRDGASKAIGNLGPDAFNGGANLLKASLNGWTLLSEKLGVLEGQFDGFRRSSAYNIDPLFSYDNKAQAGAGLLTNFGLGAATAKFAGYGMTLEDIGAVGSMGSQMGAIRISLVTPNSAAGRLLVVNREGMLYPEIPDLRTGRPIQFPDGEIGRMDKAARTSWDSSADRYAFIKEWHSRGYETPRGGWQEYDLHHVRPREFGGNNTFWNLAPVQRQTHMEMFNKFWRGY
jgi:YD repeat-containing protein